MKKPLSLSFNNTTSPPQIETQQHAIARSANMFVAMNALTSQPSSNATLYAHTNNPDFVNTVEIGFINNTGDQNFAPGDYLELDFTELQYNNAGQMEGVDTTKIACADPSGRWTIPAGQTGPKIKLQCANAFTWKKDENHSVSLNIPVNPITDPVKKIGDFAISDASHFGNNKPSNECVVTTTSFGAQQKPLPVQAYFVDPAVKIPDIPYKGDDVVFITPAGLDDIPNNLSFELDYSRLTGNGDLSRLGALELILSIQAGSDDWDLAPPDTADGIALNISHDVNYDTDPHWTISHVDNENFIQFKCIPEPETPLLPLTGGQKIRLELSNIVTALSDGTVNMTMQISGMDKFSDWCWFLVIQKEEPTPEILSFDIASPTNALLSVGQAVKLTWQTFAIKALELNYVNLVGNPVNENLSGKGMVKDGFEVVPAVANSDVPDDFTETQALPLNLVATKADGNTISKQVVVTMKAPMPILEISDVEMHVEERMLKFSYLTRYTKGLTYGWLFPNILTDFPIKNGEKQYPAFGQGNFARMLNDPDLGNDYYWPVDYPTDVKFTLVAINQNGKTSKDLYFDKIKNTGPLGWGGATPFPPVSINSISLRSGTIVDAIQINGNWYGGDGGDAQGEISFAGNVYISKIIIHYGHFHKVWYSGVFDQNVHGGDYTLVTYLEIHDNKGNVIKGGRTGSNDFERIIEGRIFMLGGNTRGDFLEALDVYYLPKL